MANYPPPNQPYFPPEHQYPPNPQQQHQYGAQPQPYYQPQQQQQQWGLQPQQQQQHFAPQGQPMTGYNDLWAFFLFLAQLAAFVALSYYAISRVKNDRQGGNGGAVLGFFSISGLITLFISIAVGAVFSIVTFAVSIIAYLAVAFYYLYRRLWLPGIVGLIFGILYASMWFFWKSRIPFASIYFMTVIAGTYELYYDTQTNSTPTTLKVLIVFCFFSFYWTSQVMENIVHTTVCGVYATYYFMKGSPQGMSKSPTIESLKRSCTTSIGSICFGSLIIAIIQTLRFLANMARSENDGIMAFVACLIECILACLQGIAEYVNKYAFAQVAIYGKSYIQAAKDTWTILKDRGVEQIINDNLIGNVWGMAGILGGVLSGVASYLYIRFANPSFNSTGEFTYVIVIMAFVMGLQIVFTVGTVIDSGVATTFVCLAEDPAALARTKPELFERIRATWPEVVQVRNDTASVSNIRQSLI
ncbi:plasma-membrane choline transporter-domain-containing protein [Dissophora ornata]|nr:plasma-membrane choline transporter-domain-containing protein [Dissophora ornata]